MSRNHKLIVVALVVICLVSSVVATERYLTRPKQPHQQTLAQAQLAEKTLQAELRVMQVVDGANIGNLKASNASLTAQKQQLCSVLSTHKLTNPVCN
jgi:Na+-transporting NADH:ubiquinone oxidoreductase subunit NqrC